MQSDTCRARVGHGSMCRRAISIASSPLTRITAIAPRPRGVPRAIIVFVPTPTLRNDGPFSLTARRLGVRSSYQAPGFAPFHSEDALAIELGGGEWHRELSTLRGQTCPSDTES